MVDDLMRVSCTCGLKTNLLIYTPPQLESRMEKIDGVKTTRGIKGDAGHANLSVETEAADNALNLEEGIDERDIDDSTL